MLCRWTWVREGTIQMAESDPSSWARALDAEEPPLPRGFLRPGAWCPGCSYQITSLAGTVGQRASVWPLRHGSLWHSSTWRGTLGEQGGSPVACNALASEVTCIISTRLYYCHKPTTTQGQGTNTFLFRPHRGHRVEPRSAVLALPVASDKMFSLPGPNAAPSLTPLVVKAINSLELFPLAPLPRTLLLKKRHEKSFFSKDILWKHHIK